jgi:aspartate aminotransferase
MPLIASRLLRVKPSPTLVVVKKTMELKQKGLDVISLGVGEPDFGTPENIKLAGIEAIKSGATKYTSVDGTVELKKAIIAKFKRENNLDYSEDQIIAGTGAKQVLYNAMMASLNAGDEVIIPSPYWVSYPDIVELAEGTPIFVKTSSSNNFKLTAQHLEQAITPKTKWLILNSPSNPTGSAYSADDLKTLAEVLLKYPSIYILSDDIYEHIVFDNFKFATIAEVEPALKDRTLTLNGVSKSYSMTGWRLGYAAGPKELIKAMAIIQSQSTSNPSSISQKAALEALNGTQEFIAPNAKLFESRRDLVLKLFNETGLLPCNKPEGAFYVFPDCSKLFGRKTPAGKIINNSDDVADYLLEEALVAVQPGTAFGMNGFFRVSYATNENILTEAITRINKVCLKLIENNLSVQQGSDARIAPIPSSQEKLTWQERIRLSSETTNNMEPQIRSRL